MPRSLSTRPPQALLRTLQCIAMWTMLAGLAVGLPLQALSSTLAGMLGSRHAHQVAPPASAASPDRSGNPMAGWADFRRANYEHLAGATPVALSGASVHRQAHEAGLRHRHDPDAADVIDLEAPADGDGAPTGTSPVGTALALAAGTGRIELSPRSTPDGAEVWRAAIARSSATPLARRIERPPSSI